MPFRYDDVMSDVRCLDGGVAIEKHFLFSNSKHLRETTDDVCVDPPDCVDLIP